MKNSNDNLFKNLFNFLKRLVKYWYVLLLCVLITLAAAFLYLRYSSKIFRVGSAVLLRIEGDTRLPAGSDNVMRAFDFIMQDKTFQNEVFFMQSYPLVREVVEDMDVRVSYYMKDSKIPGIFDFTWKNIYQDTPIMVVASEGHVQPVNLPFIIKIIDDNHFYISAEGEDVPLYDIYTQKHLGNGNTVSIKGIKRFGSLIEEQNYSFRVVLNSNYDSERFRGKDFFFQFNNLDQVAGQFKGSLSINAQGIESTMAELEFNTNNVMMGLHFLQSLIDTYIEKNLEEANMLANKTIEHIEAQLMDVTDDLTLSEQQLQNLRRSHNIMNIEEKAENIYQRLQAFRTDRDEAQRRLDHLEQMNEYFQDNRNSSKILAPSALGLNDPVLNDLIQELTALNAEKQRIISQDQLRNPRLATLEISIENLKDVVEENINFSITTTRREIESLDQEIASLNQEFSTLPQTQRELLGIERRFKLNDATYTSLLERRLQAQIVKASKMPDAKIVEPPSYRGVSSPSRTIILIAALVLGLGFPAGIIFLKQLIANKIVNREDVEMISKLPVIASIPAYKEEQKFVMNNPRTALAESFHILRSNIVYYLHGASRKVILVTSSMPDEGKSFVSVNLGSSFAYANSKTIIVEFDMRNPGKFSEVFKPDKSVGLSSYLINKASVNDIINRTKLENLDIITAGQIPPNPVELISGKRTGELLNYLKEHYDYIILDTPPFGLLTDSFLLMNYSDLKLFVVRMQTTRRSTLSSVLNDIEKKDLDKVHLLLNGVNADLKGYGKYAYIENDKKKGGLFKKKVAAL